MKITLNKSALLVLGFFAVIGSSFTTQPKRQGSTKVTIGTLDEASYTSLKLLLLNQPATPLNDTIIIKYDYNNESCWDLLDQKDDNYIKALIISEQKRVAQVLSTRKNVSAFNFLEPGGKLNKLKKWNNSLLIDDAKKLKNLLFKNRASCGNSIILLPDRRYIYFRSDSHWEALEWTHEKIIAQLNQNSRIE